MEPWNSGLWRPGPLELWTLFAWTLWGMSLFRSNLGSVFFLGNGVFRMFLLDLSLVPVDFVQDVGRRVQDACARRENPPEKRARRPWIIKN